MHEDVARRRGSERWKSVHERGEKGDESEGRKTWWRTAWRIAPSMEKRIAPSTEKRKGRGSERGGGEDGERGIRLSGSRARGGEGAPCLRRPSVRSDALLHGGVPRGGRASKASAQPSLRVSPSHTRKHSKRSTSLGTQVPIPHPLPLITNKPKKNQKLPLTRPPSRY